MNHSVELRLVLWTFVVSFFWRNKWKSVHVGAFIVLLKSVEVIFPCRRLPANQISFFDLNCCHLSYLVYLRREISDSFSALKLLFTSAGWTSMLKQGSNSKFGNISPLFVSSTSIRNNIFDPFSMKTTLQAANFKNRFNRVSNCAITQDICSRLLGLLHAFVYQSYNKCRYFSDVKIKKISILLIKARNHQTSFNDNCSVTKRRHIGENWYCILDMQLNVFTLVWITMSAFLNAWLAESALSC